ncbi:hypothetical protein JG688_00002691 [Phytophthora aleatoria]|uniref:Uncharacterized protein n=1 Tax=Phytophthora aleatoria TaxID=2496075 RepID=A0A8J5JF62_9STRA|nr:hypothetical protein JG688_00002691 [Phytophthora aleatoria]
MYKQTFETNLPFSGRRGVVIVFRDFLVLHLFVFVRLSPPLIRAPRPQCPLGSDGPQPPPRLSLLSQQQAPRSAFPSLISSYDLSPEGHCCRHRARHRRRHGLEQL